MPAMPAKKKSEVMGQNVASVSVVVPVYNSAGTLSELAARIHASLLPITRNFEVILVNDGSQDASWARIGDLVTQYDSVHGIDLMRNFGQHNALLAGIRDARYEAVVTLDDDLQQPPEEIPRLIGKLDEGYDIIYGIPVKLHHGLWRNFASRLTKFILTHLIGISDLTEMVAFRAFRTQIRDAFMNYTGPDVDIDALLSWGSNRYALVPVRYEPRLAGSSGYTFRKLVRLTLYTLTSFSAMPLRLASFVGGIFVLFGFGLFAYVVGRYLLEGGSVPGFPLLASAVALFSGVQLSILGIMGEYLARIHFRVMGRPSSVIRTRTNAAAIPPTVRDVARAPNPGRPADCA
jgi:undecaprenyl-phosphate 4-deoxy-4-formamido-L-arabinose transferase